MRIAVIAGVCAVLPGCGGAFEDPGLAEPGFVALAAHGCADRLGCATDQNIAAMLDRPGDLAMARRSRPRDAIRREAILSAYRGEAPGEAGPQAGAHQ